jgi:hypothetical protein
MFKKKGWKLNFGMSGAFVWGRFVIEIDDGTEVYN